MTVRSKPHGPVRVDRRVFLSLALGGLAAGCSTPDPTVRFADLTFAGRPPIQLDVAHRAPLAPGAAAERWARDVLRATGNSGRGVFRVTKGSLVATPLPTTGGVKGWFTVDQAERYDAAIEGRIDLYGADGRRFGEAAAQATRYQTIAESASLNDRQRLWYTLVEATSRDFAAAMEQAIRRELAGYIR